MSRAYYKPQWKTNMQTHSPPPAENTIKYGVKDRLGHHAANLIGWLRPALQFHYVVSSVPRRSEQLLREGQGK